MSISLSKGQKISLSKDSAGNNTGLNNIIVGLGWDEAQRKGGFFSKPAPIDCDASVIMLKDGVVQGKEDLIYFGNLTHKSGSVKHLGDNLTGAGDGDDEQITIDLSKVPQDVDRIMFVVNIYDCINRKQHFGMILNAFIRVVNQSTNVEICKFNLSEDYANMTTLITGEIYRHNGEWKFNPLGQATTDASFGHVANKYKQK